jgi:hypothetical protein
MNLLRFSFKNEAMWMTIFAFGPAAVALLILLVVYLVRSLI